MNRQELLARARSGMPLSGDEAAALADYADGGAVGLLAEFRDELPDGHAEKAGVIRSIEVLRNYGKG